MIARTWPASLRAGACFHRWRPRGGQVAGTGMHAARPRGQIFMLGAAEPALFAVGRLALPSSASPSPQPGAAGRAGSRRLSAPFVAFGSRFPAPRLTLFFIALGGLGWGWWPLNIMFTLFVAAAVLWLLEVRSSSAIAGAIVLFLIGGLFVEFWWPALAYILAAWLYCRLAVAAPHGVDRRRGLALPDQ